MAIKGIITSNSSRAVLTRINIVISETKVKAHSTTMILMIHGAIIINGKTHSGKKPNGKAEIAIIKIHIKLTVDLDSSMNKLKEKECKKDPEHMMK